MHSGFPTSPYLSTPFSYSTNNSSDTLEAMDEDSHSPTNENENARELSPRAFFNAEMQTNPEKQTQLWQNFSQCIDSLKKDDYEQLERDIESCPDLRSSLDEEGYSLVHYYIRINKEAINFEYLKKLQLNINIKDSLGFTTLQHAISLVATAKGKGENVDRRLVGGLINLGAEVNVSDSHGNTALHHAVKQGLPDIVSLLCENKAKVDSQDKLGNVAFHYAISKQNIMSGKSREIIKTLHKYEANPNIQDQEGRTPLHLIFFHFNALDREDQNRKELAFITAIKALLNAGTDKNIADKLGRPVWALDKNDLFKKAAGLSKDHPISSLAFKEDFVTREAPSLQNAQEWRHIPKFAIITGPNGSGKSHLLAYAQAFLMKFGRNKIDHIYKDSQSLEKYVPAKDEIYNLSSYSSCYSWLRRREKEIIYEALNILQKPSNTSSNPIVNALVQQIQKTQQIQIKFNSATDQFAREEIVSEQYITLQVRDILKGRDPSSRISELIAQQIKQDEKSIDIPDEEILNYGRRAIKKNKEPLNSFHALSELARVFREKSEERTKIFEKYNSFSNIDTLISAYRAYIESQPSSEYCPKFTDFIKHPKNLQKLLDKIADDEVGAVPWIKLNEVFRDNGLDLRLYYDDSNSPNYSKRLYFKKEINGVVQTITIDQPDRLSAGERLILDTLSWQYYIDKTGIVSKISMILLDEPDRHFDPEWSKIFMNCLTYLSEEHNIQVMMTTHRPDTLAYAPEGSIFTIERDKVTNNASIQPINRLHALFKLTPNLREITTFHIKVYTEAFDDATFYERVYQQLLRISEAKRKTYTTSPDGLLRKPRDILSRRFQLAFYSIALEKTGTGGGRDSIFPAMKREKLALDHMEKLGVKSLIKQTIQYPFAIIDADMALANRAPPAENIPTAYKNINIAAQISFTKRHSLENYLYDPVILLSILGKEGIQTSISDEKFKKLALNCLNLLEEGEGDFLQTFTDYFRYFIEKFIFTKKVSRFDHILGRKVEEYKYDPDDLIIDEDEYIKRYQYITFSQQPSQPTKRQKKAKERVDLREKLPKDLGMAVNSTKEAYIEALLVRESKEVTIFSPYSMQSYQITYPGLFIYAHGHSLEACFRANFLREVDNHQDSNYIPFKQKLLDKMVTSPALPLPEDLVEIILELNQKAREQANAVIKPRVAAHAF